MAYEGYLARGVGWFSLGLGAVQVLMPARLGRFIGVGDGARTQLIMRAVGLRELAAAVGIFLQDRPTPWLLGRVGGDAMDLAALGAAMRSDSAQGGRVAGAIGAVAGITMLDVLLSFQFSERPNLTTRDDLGIRVINSVTVGRSPSEVYDFWHDFRNLPRFMRHLESVQVDGNGRSHWKAKAPAGMSAEWDAETVEDRPNELIMWRSLPDADVENAGSVRFIQAPGNRGTQVRVELWYGPPGGPAGAAIARLFGEEPSRQVGDDLRAFKQMMEIGEVVRSDASAAGGHPAQPPARLPQM
jgi:uncharacterized membrane protein